MKQQCSKDYFYGIDLKIEKALQGSEGKYASIVKGIIEESRFGDSDLSFLRDFCYLQYLRTDTAIRRTALAQQDMTDLIFDGHEDQKPAPIVQKELVEQAFGIFSESVDKIDDLKVCLVRNSSRRPFVTSDDPAAFVNRFYIQRIGPPPKSAGFENAGAILILPLSPSLLMCSYDGGVYTVPDSRGHVVEITKETDAVALNAIQYIKASQNIYFSTWDHCEKVRRDFDSVSSRRPEKWHKLHYAVRDTDRDLPESTCFRVVHTKAERDSADEAIVHLEGVMLNPGTWFSKLKFRNKPRYIDTKSGGRYLRHSASNL